MARASKIIRKTSEKVLLELTQKEAQALANVFNWVCNTKPSEALIQPIGRVWDALNLEVDIYSNEESIFRSNPLQKTDDPLGEKDQKFLDDLKKGGSLLAKKDTKTILQQCATPCAGCSSVSRT